MVRSICPTPQKWEIPISELKLLTEVNLELRLGDSHSPIQPRIVALYFGIICAKYCFL